MSTGRMEKGGGDLPCPHALVTQARQADVIAFLLSGYGYCVKVVVSCPHTNTRDAEGKKEGRHNFKSERGFSDVKGGACCWGVT
jgi:hypothetical protein